jgi:hypothetical protein
VLSIGCVGAAHMQPPAQTADCGEISPRKIVLRRLKTRGERYLQVTKKNRDLEMRRS